MPKFGLVGFPLAHSFSSDYFNKKFSKNHLWNHQYSLFPLQSIDELHFLINSTPDLLGLNITIPYKETVIPFLNLLDKNVSDTKAVNTIKIIRKNSNYLLEGYNTDVKGFNDTLISLIKKVGLKDNYGALILGTGGAAKAVAYVLKQLNINFHFVSRSKNNEFTYLYNELSKEIITTNKLIINATPLGMYPDINFAPALNYDLITPHHILYDLIYNPHETLFIKEGLKRGAHVCNGLEMLYSQAEESWKIWINDKIIPCN